MSEKINVSFSNHDPKGYGYLSWERLEKRLVQCGELTEQQKLQAVEVTEDGIEYSTRKKRKNES